MVLIRDIPFRDIPSQSSLFLSYLDFSPPALSFFQCPPTIENLCHDLRNQVLQRQYPRSEIVSILRRQNESYGCAPETLRQIDRLEDQDCVAILTGQQVGIFTGPLYTIYKALSAIHLCDALEKRGIKAVPVFWMETEDHDLDEVTHQTVIGRDNSAQIVDYRGILFGPNAVTRKPVGSIEFPAAIREAVDDFTGHLPDTDWKSGIRSRLESAYRPGRTFTQSFAELFSYLMKGTGLILFDARDPQAKPLVSDIFRWAVENSEDIHRALVKRNLELKAAGFHAQVSTPDNATVLFRFEDGERYALERQDAGFGLKNGNRRFSRRELLALAGSAPENFSPNVLLRPIIQDSLFPTLAYVGGPAELAYFAQIETLYALCEQPMPAIWPRDSFTLLEAEIRDAMDRMGIEIGDCFKGIQSLTGKTLHNAGINPAGAGIQALKERLENTFIDIRPDLRNLDPSLVRALDTAQSKILHNIRRLESRILRFEGSRNSRILDTAGFLLGRCFPNGNLQERELSIFHFLARRGPAVLDAIRSGTGTSGFLHRVLQLE
jgi:bacillithiol synthase